MATAASMTQNAPSASSTHPISGLPASSRPFTRYARPWQYLRDLVQPQISPGFDLTGIVGACSGAYGLRQGSLGSIYGKPRCVERHA